METSSIHIIPCLRDNYAYLIEGDGGAILVDPSEAAPIQEILAERNLSLTAILLTHHHYDHTGGLTELLGTSPHAAVLAMEPDASRIHGVTRRVQHEEQLVIAGLSFQCLAIPGHTLGATAFVLDQRESSSSIFTGDTLFAAGCGRIFEGTAAQMYHSLNVILAHLPGDTLVYCGHEYTESNLRFAAHVDPTNDAIQQRLAKVRSLRSSNQPTIPSTMVEERATNPFLRCSSPASRAFTGLDDEVEVFQKLRSAKDSFRA